jgi:hypothetical protein
MRRRAALVVGLLLLGGCRGATSGFGPDAATARANADALMSALQQRFTRVVRHPKFLNARMRIGRYAFSPSKLVNDTALWSSMRTAQAGAVRDLEVSGAMSAGQYTFRPLPGAATPSRTGDSRHVIGLSKLAQDGDWQWTTLVENAVGTVPPARMTDVMRAFFASAERPSASIRNDYRGAFPRSTAAFGRMFALDSLGTTPQTDGSTLVVLQLLASDARLKDGFPELAKYVRKYIGPARFRLRLTDRSGGDWFDVAIDKSRIVMRFRSRDGELQPISGSARRMPDTLAVHIEGSAKISFFRVGAKDLLGEFVHVNTSTERAWSMRFTREPEWDLPPLAEQLLHSPLRRPFEDQGIRFRIGFATVGGQTVMARTARVAVRESAIMRFLGNLGFTALSDYAGKVEEEEDRFLSEAFAALRADLDSL